MKISRILLHGLVLAGINLAAIIQAFGIYYLVRPDNQIIVQGPIAALLSLLFFMIWFVILRRLLPGWQLKSRREATWVYLASLVWAPILFVPLHYLTQGYLTSLGNLVSIWLFQIPTNFLALILALKNFPYTVPFAE